MRKIGFLGFCFVSILSSSILASVNQNCYLTMMLKPDFYYIASPFIVKTDHVQIVATVLQKKGYPIYQHAIGGGTANKQFDISELEQLSFDLPNVPGLVSELKDAQQDGRVLYMDFSWLSEDCSAFKDFQFRSGKKYAHFTYNPEHMNYKLHAMNQ